MTEKHEELKFIISKSIDSGGPGTEHSKMRCVLYKLKSVQDAKATMKRNSTGMKCHLFSLTSRKAYTKGVAEMANDEDLEDFRAKLLQFHQNTFKGLTKFRRAAESHFGQYRLGLIDGIHRTAALHDILLHKGCRGNCMELLCTANFSVMKNTNTSVEQFLTACIDLSLHVKNAVKSGVDHTVHDSILDLIQHALTRDKYIVVHDIGFYSLLLNITSSSDKVKARENQYSENTAKVTNEFAKICHSECMKVLDY